MDILQLYQDFSIDFVTEGHKHTQEGWVNTECPYCEGNPGYHMGYNLTGDFYHCWRCGSHPIILTLTHLLHLPYKEVEQLVKQYDLTLSKTDTAKKVIIGSKVFKYPSDVGPLSDYHKHYLQSRNFDPDYLIKTWQLLSAGPVSMLDKYEYKNRIIIPYEWNGQTVTFDSRSISKSASHEKRYKACPKEYEIIDRKEILYGKQEDWKSTGILVEGPTDVWRMGTSSYAVSGIQYTPNQVRAISKQFRRMAVCFDDDPQARIQATKIVAELKFRGVDAFRVDIKGDPGSMQQSDADYLVKQLIS